VEKVLRRNRKPDRTPVRTTSNSMYLTFRRARRLDTVLDSIQDGSVPSNLIVGLISRCVLQFFCDFCSAAENTASVLTAAPSISVTFPQAGTCSFLGALKLHKLNRTKCLQLTWRQRSCGGIRNEVTYAHAVRDRARNRRFAYARRRRDPDVNMYNVCQ